VTRRYLSLAALVAVVLSLSVGCNNEKKTPSLGNPQFTTTTGGAGAPGQPSAAAGPSTTYKDTKPCNTMRNFVLAAYYATQAPKERSADYLATAQRAANEAKAEVPALAADIDTYYELTGKSVNGTATEADRGTNDRVARAVSGWVESNCR
jgi:hypothetical protein